jgi:hypothetical protein
MGVRGRAEGSAERFKPFKAWVGGVGWGDQMFPYLKVKI